VSASPDPDATSYAHPREETGQVADGCVGNGSTRR
jgi:hypothetical protein